MSFNPFSLPPELQVDHYIPPVPPEDKRYSCEDCDVNWTAEGPSSECWMCGELKFIWRIEL